MRVQHSHDFYIVAPDNSRIATANVVVQHNVHWVSNVWVHPDHRKKGYATSVLQAVIDHYDQVDMYLNVQPYTDMPMGEALLTRWYRKFGFTPIDNAPGMMVRRVNQ